METNDSGSKLWKTSILGQNYGKTILGQNYVETRFSLNIPEKIDPGSKLWKQIGSRSKLWKNRFGVKII